MSRTPGFNVTRPELFARNRPFEMKTLRAGVRVPDGWISMPDYVGAERRRSDRRIRADRREFSRIGDGRIPRRSGYGRRSDDHRGLYGSRPPAES